MNLIKYKRVNSELDLILKYIIPKNKTIIDAGCGSGYLTLKLSNAGGKVYGIDTPAVINKLINLKHKNAFFKPGKSENLPFENEFADAIIYYSSFHHVAKDKMTKAIEECNRVLKVGGLAVFVEPSLEKGCYFELLRIVLDERKIQKYAYKIIKTIPNYGFNPVTEKHIYLIRTFNDFSDLVNKFIKNKKDKQTAILKAEKKIIDRKKNNRLFRSTARINIYKKIHK
jgi:ubiquinone/menaquinone biosynthesis C-methylase UbiE